MFHASQGTDEAERCRDVEHLGGFGLDLAVSVVPVWALAAKPLRRAVCLELGIQLHGLVAWPPQREPEKEQSKIGV